MAKYFAVNVKVTQTVEYSVKADSAEEAIRKYEDGNYIDGYPNNDEEYEVIDAKESD